MVSVQEERDSKEQHLETRVGEGGGGGFAMLTDANISFRGDDMFLN